MSVLEWVAALRATAIAIMALQLIAVKLVGRIPPSSCVFGRVTLGLVNGMMETSLPSPSHRDGESTAVHRAPLRGHARGPSSPLHHRNPSHLG